MRVLADRHHAALLHSLQLLFEDRLGFELFVPVGREWWDQGYWRFGLHAWGDDRLGRQFLGYGDVGLDAAWRADGDQWLTVDPHYPWRPIRGVTVDQARALGGWRFVVATVQDNQQGFHRLAGELGAAYVLQVGNTSQQVDWELDPLAIVSSEVPVRGRGVVCHQEFDARGLFGFADPALADRRVVSSFVNCFPSTGCYAQYLACRDLLSCRFSFRCYGIDGPEGNVESQSAVAAAMASSGFGWHDKVQGDGFGHVIHGWAAVGRPLVGHASHYAGRMAGPLWEDGVTCVDLDVHGADGAARLLERIVADPDRHAEMCGAVRSRFDELVDFDAEERAVRELLGL